MGCTLEVIGILITMQFTIWKITVCRGSNCYVENNLYNVTGKRSITTLLLVKAQIKICENKIIQASNFLTMVSLETYRNNTTTTNETNKITEKMIIIFTFIIDIFLIFKYFG